MDRVKTIAADAEETYVVTNNHNLGEAMVNVLELKAFLTGEAITPPPQLVERFPESARLCDCFAMLWWARHEVVFLNAA